ncbi:C3a anaphylatoxin chemotactic receptor-like [Salvelinus namaycush]|uniref:C3a anaphylatoxin chemotactic receptor-like n=1 Tax=Salvelinus namaycush TaxID=8040 RepID=A0A8U0TMH3_SALNM|nr:C3a anaphylatoxin chemotactic receptor-like [Salvelinus namaycush]
MTPNATIPFALVTSAARDDEAKVVDIDAIMNKLNIVLLTLTIVLGTTGNSVVIWVAGFKLKPTVTNVWLVNLAVADLIFCLSRVLSLTKKLFFDYWPFGIFLCKFNGFFRYTNMFCSVFLLAVISMDRTLCVWHPVFTKRRRTICAARLVSACVWAVAAILSAPHFAYRQVYLGKNNLSRCSLDVKESTKGDNSANLALYLMRFLCGFLLPFLIILCCYILAGLGIRRTRLLGKSRPLRILVSLVCAFVLCWAPYHCLLLAKMVNSNSKLVTGGLTVATAFTYFNSCVNPLLYFCMGLDMRGSRFRQSLAGVYRRALADDRDGRFTQSNERTVDDSSGSASRLAMVNVANVSLN